MNPKIAISSLLALNVLLLVSNTFVTSALTKLGENENLELRTFQEESHRLAAVRVRLEAKLSSLTRLVAELKRARFAARQTSRAAPAKSPPQTPTPPDDLVPSKPSAESNGYASLLEHLRRIGLEDRPDPEAIPLMSETDRQALNARLAAMPKLSTNALTTGNLYGIINDESWNPTGRELNEQELNQLQHLVKEFTYFANYAHMERYWKYVHSNVKALREQGVFAEYRQGDVPPAVAGVVYSHAEPAEESGYMRIFYLHAEDHPDIQHHKQVEAEQVRRAYADVYALINGS